MKLISLLALLMGLFPQVLHGQDRPNVIVIMTDDQGIGDFGCMGNPLVQTPNIDQMYQRSVQFSNFYVHPVCTPTRACLMTGRYNYRTRAIDTYIGRAMMDPDEVTIAEKLKSGRVLYGHFWQVAFGRLLSNASDGPRIRLRRCPSWWRNWPVVGSTWS